MSPEAPMRSACRREIPSQFFRALLPNGMSILVSSPDIGISCDRFHARRCCLLYRRFECGQDIAHVVDIEPPLVIGQLGSGKAQHLPVLTCGDAAVNGG